VTDSADQGDAGGGYANVFRRDDLGSGAVEGDGEADAARVECAGGASRVRADPHDRLIDGEQGVYPLIDVDRVAAAQDPSVEDRGLNRQETRLDLPSLVIESDEIRGRIADRAEQAGHQSPRLDRDGAVRVGDRHLGPRRCGP